MKFFSTVRVIQPECRAANRIPLFSYERDRHALTFCAKKVRPPVCAAVFAVGRFLYKDCPLTENSLLDLSTDEKIRNFANDVSGYGFLLVYKPWSALICITDKTGLLSPCYVRKGHHYHIDYDAQVLANATVGALDDCSMTEFLATGRITAPHTIWQHVYSLNHASIVQFDSCLSSAFYWEPRLMPPLNADDFAAALAEEIERFISMLSRIYKRCSLLLSGGLDARAFLPALSAGGKGMAFNTGAGYNERSASEQLIAEQLARHYGIPLVKLDRRLHDWSQIFRCAPQVLSPGYDYRHACMLAHSCIGREPGTIVLSGCFADHFFKMKSCYRNNMSFSQNIFEWFGKCYALMPANRHKDEIDARRQRYLQTAGISHFDLSNREDLALACMKRTLPLSRLRTYALRDHLIRCSTPMFPFAHNLFLDLWQHSWQLKFSCPTDAWIMMLAKTDPDLLAIRNANTNKPIKLSGREGGLKCRWMRGLTNVVRNSSAGRRLSDFRTRIQGHKALSGWDDLAYLTENGEKSLSDALELPVHERVSRLMLHGIVCDKAGWSAICQSREISLSQSLFHDSVSGIASRAHVQ